ncbi:hypothetical protein D3C76_1686240 [compost metagenome]
MKCHIALFEQFAAGLLLPLRHQLAGIFERRQIMTGGINRRQRGDIGFKDQTSDH